MLAFISRKIQNLEPVLKGAVRITLAVAILSALVLSYVAGGVGNHHYIYLAHSFLSGSFSVNDLPVDYIDKIAFDGNIYLPFAPLPAILLMPFAALVGVAFDELWLAWLIALFTVLLLGVSLKHLRIPRKHRPALLILFFLGTVYLSVATVGRSWFLAQLAAVFFLVLAINEMLSKRRAWLVGIWLGFAFLSRSTTICSFPFFIWLFKPEGTSLGAWRKWLVPSSQIVLGIAISLLFFMYYNLVRFNNPIETGYAHAVLNGPTLESALSYGLFSPIHIPKNLFALLLATPLAYPSFSAPVLSFPYIYPSPWGMGLFFTTPAFVYVFAADRSERIVQAAWLAIGFVLIPLLTYYGVGWVQFGYRYALDFYPFLFILTALGLSTHINSRTRALVLLCVVINVWGMWWELLGFYKLPLELAR